MAARGSYSKEQITNKILEVFSGSFINGKEIRIPMSEDGAEVQIKVTLTAAKENIDNPNGNVASAGSVSFDIPTNNNNNNNEVPFSCDGPTEEEKKKVKELCQKLQIITD